MVPNGCFEAVYPFKTYTSSKKFRGNSISLIDSISKLRQRFNSTLKIEISRLTEFSINWLFRRKEEERYRFRYHMLFKSDVPRSARKLVTRYRRRLFSKFMPRISRFTRRRKLGHCVSKEGWLAPRWIAKLKRARYIYILRGWRGGHNGPEGRGGWLNDRETMTKFLVDCVPLWATCLRVYDSNVLRDYRRFVNR